MKRLLFIIPFLISVAYGQSKLYMRADTVQIYKQGGSGELKLQNSTKSTIGPLINVGDGITHYQSWVAVADSIGLYDSTAALRAKILADSNALRTVINTKQNISDTSSVDATRYWVLQQGYSTGGGTNIYNTNGTLTGNRTVDLSGNNLTISEDANNYFDLGPTYLDIAFESGGNTGELIVANTGVDLYGSNATATNSINVKPDNQGILMTSTEGADGTRIAVSPTVIDFFGGLANTTIFRMKVNGVINIPTISNYANNAAAIAAGLVAGDIYRNGDILMIVH